MSLLIAGALPGSPIAPGSESQASGETADGSFGDMLAQLFAAPGQEAEALEAELEAGSAGLQVAEYEFEESESQPTPLATLLALPHLTVATPSPISLSPPATPEGSEGQPVGTQPAQPSDPAMEPVAAPGFEQADAPTETEELPVAPNGQPIELSTPSGEEPPTSAPAAIQPPVESTQPSSPSTAAATETNASVVRPVGNANASNGKSDGNPERGRPQFANNVVAAAHSASQTGGGAVAEVAHAARADSPAPMMAPEHVIEAVIERAEAGGGEVHIRLDPPELGEVTIRVITEGDSVRVHIQVERPEAAQLLKNAAGALESLLAERGLDLSDVFVGADQRGSEQQFGDQPGSADDESATPFSALLSAPPSAEVRQHNRIRSAYNPDGALLYLV